MSSLQEFFSNSLNSFEEDQDVDGALKYLDLRDLQSRFRDLSVTLMPHVSFLCQLEIQVTDCTSKSSVSSS